MSEPKEDELSLKQLAAMLRGTDRQNAMSYEEARRIVEEERLRQEARKSPDYKRTSLFSGRSQK